MAYTKYQYTGPVQEKWDIPPDWQKQEAENQEDDEAENQELAVVDDGPPQRVKPGPKPDKYGCDLVKPGDNARYLKYARVALNLPPIDIADPNQVQNRINEYFEFCENHDRKPNIIGMANWLGVTRETIKSWRAGEVREGTHSYIIQRAISLLEEQWVDYMLNGKVNPASGIFIGKNHYQYRDQQDYVLTPGSPLEGLKDDEAQQRMIEALPDEDE